MDDSGDFVIAWESRHQDGSADGVFARRFSSSGASIGDFMVNSYTTGEQVLPSVAMAADGRFVVVWQSFGQDGYYQGVFARGFSSSTVAVGVEFQVSAYSTGPQYQPSVAMDAAGEFVVAWRASELQARRFSSVGTPLSPDFQVNTYTPSTARYPAVAAQTGGRFVVAWENFGQDGEAYGIFARRLISPATIDVDGDGETDALTDGLLALRWLFGFTGAALTTGAVDLSDCTRCNAAMIEPYLLGLD